VVHGMPEVQQSSGLRLGWTEDFNQQLFVYDWPGFLPNTQLLHAASWTQRALQACADMTLGTMRRSS